MAPDLTLFGEIAALLVLVAFVGAIAAALRQPLIVAYIAAGMLAGPELLGLARSVEHIEVLSDLGVALLLFLVGLKLDPALVRSVGGVAFATGIGQVGFTSVIGFGLCLLLGLDAMESAFVAVALTFSSTIIIVKLLSDLRELDSLHGRIALGFLIVQDIIVVIAMFLLSATGLGAGAARGITGSALLDIVVLIAAVAAFARFGAERILRRLASSPELVASCALAWTALLAAATDQLGAGKELGGLLAGVSLASTSARDALAARLAGLRDFLLLFFFVGLGARFALGELGASVPAAIGLSLFVLVGNPLIVMLIMGAMGYRSRTGFLAGLTVAQISEFSLVFVALGARLGHVSSDTVGLVTLVGVVTIAVSSYMIYGSHALYARLEPVLGVFERRRPSREHEADARRPAEVDVIVLGLGTLGARIGDLVQDAGASVFGVDFDPEALASWTRAGRPGMWGDASDPELIASLPRDARCVVIALSLAPAPLAAVDARAAIVQSLRASGWRGSIAVTSKDAADAEALRTMGADVVLTPAEAAAERMAELVLARGSGARG